MLRASFRISENSNSGRTEFFTCFTLELFCSQDENSFSQLYWGGKACICKKNLIPFKLSLGVYINGKPHRHKLGTCCSSSFVTDHQAGCAFRAAGAHFCLAICSVKDPAALPGSSWLCRLQQLLLQGQPYLVPCGRFPPCYRKVYAATQFSLLIQNGLSADKEQPGLLCCYNPDPCDPESWLLLSGSKPCLTQADGNPHRITESQNSRGWKGPLWVI